MNTGLHGYCNKGIPVPRVLCHSLTEVTEVMGKGMGILQNFRSSGYGYGSVIELTEVPGIVARAYRTHRSSGQVQKCCTRTPGICGMGVQSSQKFRVRVLMSYRTYRSSGYGYECTTELTEVL